MKKAYFVVGAEGSGARVITQAICSAGVFGDSGHSQSMDDLKFDNAPDRIVLRRTTPHGNYWPQLADIATKMVEAGFEVIPLLIIRNTIPNIESQVRNKHAKTHRVAHDTINYALEKIHMEFASIGLLPTIIHFESFVKYSVIRDKTFHSLGLAPPSIDFHDPSEKYRTSQDPVVISHSP